MFRPRAATPDLAAIIRDMSRRTIIHYLLNTDPGFPVDFSPEFLEAKSDDQLRHLYLAVRLQAERKQRESPSR